MGEGEARDRRLMRQALGLARRALGTVWPNPAVGAVITRGQGDAFEIVGRGWTQPGGRPHAETEALARAGGRARGGTLFVSLEPCAHQGRTPPCADAVIEAGLARVVVATRDPDPRVAGEGIARLRAAGIAVGEPVLEDEARWLNAGHLLRQIAGRPFVQLKLAVSADGRIAPGTGRPVWVTDAVARARGHLMRARSDAILVGRGTVEADDPELTCRLPGLEDRSPLRVVLDSALRISPQSRLIASAEAVPLWIFCAPDAPMERQGTLLEAGALVQRVPRGADGGLDLAAVLAELAGRGITRLLVEGGPHVARAFLDAGLVDEVVIFRGSAALGRKGLLPFVDDGLERVTEGDAWQIGERHAAGDGTETPYRARDALARLHTF